MFQLTKEQKLIEAIKEWTESTLIGDDCAQLSGKMLVSTDSLVEGTHFIWDLIDPEDLGWKACAVNLSDMAAMAGRPRDLLVALTLAPYVSQGEVRRFYKGFVDCARQYRARLVGGDLTSGPAVSVTVTVIGEEHENGCLLRSGAKPGDLVVTCGDFGASAAGLIWLKTQRGQRTASQSDRIPELFKHCVRAHLRPLPKLCEAWALVRKVASRGALMDASDGLADALMQISRASKVGLRIDLAKVAIDNGVLEIAASSGRNAVELALYGGEDYALVGTMPEAMFRNWTGSENPFKEIGSVTSGDQIELFLAGKPAAALDLNMSFQHELPEA